MRGYRIIKGKNGYRFTLIPCNNNSFPLGQSRLYTSIDECRCGLKTFADLIKKNKVNKETSNILSVVKRNDKYYFIYKYSADIIFERVVGYSGNNAKNNCLKTIKGIYEYIDEYTTNEIAN